MEVLDFIIPAVSDSFRLEVDNFPERFWEYAIYEVSLGPELFDRFLSEINREQWFVQERGIHTDVKLVKGRVEVYVPVFVTEGEEGMSINLGVHWDMQIEDPWMFLLWQQRYN